MAIQALEHSIVNVEECVFQDMPNVCTPDATPLPAARDGDRLRRDCVMPNSIGVLAASGATVRVAASTFAAEPRNGTGPCMFLEASGGEFAEDAGGTIYTDVAANDARVGTSSCLDGTGRVLPLDAGSNVAWPAVAATQLEQLQLVRCAGAAAVLATAHGRRIRRRVPCDVP